MQSPSEAQLRFELQRVREGKQLLRTCRIRVGLLQSNAVFVFGRPGFCRAVSALVGRERTASDQTFTTGSRGTCRRG